MDAKLAKEKKGKRILICFLHQRNFFLTFFFGEMSGVLQNFVFINCFHYDRLFRLCWSRFGAAWEKSHSAERFFSVGSHPNHIISMAKCRGNTKIMLYFPEELGKQKYWVILFWRHVTCQCQVAGFLKKRRVPFNSKY